MSDGVDEALELYFAAFRDRGLSIDTTECGGGWVLVDVDSVCWAAVPKSADDTMDHLLLLNQFDVVEQVADMGYEVERVLASPDSPHLCLFVSLVCQETDHVVMTREVGLSDVADIVGDMMRGVATQMMMDSAEGADA